MKCPRCNIIMNWQSDFTCDEFFGCPCEKGVVGTYDCPNCNCNIIITTDCEGDEQ